MIVLRLYDPDRRPPSWTEIIRPGQFAVFAKHVESGGACDGNGQPFGSAAEVTCVIFDSIGEARRFCEVEVERTPSLRFEIFDAGGRANPPILIVVNPAHAHRLDIDPRRMRRRKRLAMALAVGALPLFWYDYSASGRLILPTVLGINMIIGAARLFQLNMAVRGAERERQERCARHSDPS